MIKIKNWSEFQHFKDRNPPWIKLYKTILERRDIAAVSDRNFRVLVGLWLLASEDKTQEGILPDIPEIAFRLRFSEDDIAESIQILNEFLIHDDKLTISPQYQDDVPETETYKQETETELKPIAHPEPDAPTSKQLRESFEDIWGRYPEKKGKEKAWIKFKNQVNTAEAWDNINLALHNYIADVKGIRANGQPDLQWQYGSTWFNQNWRDYVDYKGPPDLKVLHQSLTQEELLAKIGEQMQQVRKYVDAGQEIDFVYLHLNLGQFLEEYEVRFQMEPINEQGRRWFNDLKASIQEKEAQTETEENQEVVSGHNDLIARITLKMAHVDKTMASDEWQSAPLGLNWLNETVGHLILEYSERFPKGPHIDKYSAWLDHQTEIVMHLTQKDAEQ